MRSGIAWRVLVLFAFVAAGCASTDRVMTRASTTSEPASTSTTTPFPDARFRLPGDGAVPVLIIQNDVAGGPRPIEEALTASADIVVFGNGVVRTRPSRRATGLYQTGFIAPEDLSGALDRAAQHGLFEPGADFDGGQRPAPDGSHLVVRYQSANGDGTIRVGNIDVGVPESLRLRRALDDLLSIVRSPQPANPELPAIEPEGWSVRQITADFGRPAELDIEPWRWPLAPELAPAPDICSTISHAEMLEVFDNRGEPMALATLWLVDNEETILSFAPVFAGERGC